MDAYKGQDNEKAAKPCRENNHVLITVSHNLTNKLQSLDITINKPARRFNKEKYNLWYTEQVTKQLGKVKDLADVAVS